MNLSLNELIIDSNILKYFNALSYTGYINNYDTKALLVLLYLQELLDGKYGKLSKEQIQEIYKLKHCIECSSCYTTNISNMKYKE